MFSPNQHQSRHRQHGISFKKIRLQTFLACISWRLFLTTLLVVMFAINWQTGKQLTAHFVHQAAAENPWPQNSIIQVISRPNKHEVAVSRGTEDRVSEDDIELFKSVMNDPVHSNPISTGVGQTSYNLSQEDHNKESLLFSWQNKSSVDYFGCCGAGHRLSRTANAYWVARHILNFGLRVYWRFCGTVEVFSYLFHPQPVEELTNVTSWNQNVYFHNEIPGFVPLSRVLVETKGKRSCKCKHDKIQSDAEFYASLRNRYRFRDQVNRFREQHFDGADLRIGLHIRAGNNETGDFTIKGRGIERIDEWVQHVAGHILSLVRTWAGKSTRQQSANVSTSRVVVYLATDTPSMLSTFRSLLMANVSTTASSFDIPHSIQVVEFPQRRLKEGGGVVFGASETGEMDGANECLQSWRSIFADLMLLSHVEILVAPRSSSFTQTLPMSLVFAQRLEQLQLLEQQQVSSGYNSSRVRLPPAFCDMNRNASIMSCYDTFLQWCCESMSYETGTHFPVPGKKLKWDVVPRRETCLPSPEARGRPGYCLPFRWPKDMQEQRPVISRHRRRRDKLKR